ncbi:MAG: tryptophanyl-tRNA synthetase [Parcubacteria group bacterium Licking1014_17]|nr:MAG: tryptophanyl-tRNA synthetase [Parcubacteria group bacterium Licking1014_17]
MNRIFSGVRPSGKIHLGNYLGALKKWVELQDDKQTESIIYAVVDYHGITTPFDPKEYKMQIMEAALDFLSVGVNPEKSLLIRQSHVPQHTELAWIFNTITPVSWLERLPNYKEKLASSPKYNHMGLLDYPVLMAADILLYKSNAVPVGEDQKPHIDITNEIAKKFNSMFGETFEPVKPIFTEAARIMSLQEPSKKMSKTGDDGIALTDDPDAIREKIKRAVTDSGSEIIYDSKNKPAISNLLMIYHVLSGKSLEDLTEQYQNKNYSQFKNDLAEIVVGYLEPIQKRRKEFSGDMDAVEKILTNSEKKAIDMASATLAGVKAKMGLL